MSVEKFLIENIPKGDFKPYTYFDPAEITLSVYFKNDEYYVENINEEMDVFKSFEFEEIVGCRLYLDGKFIRIIPDDFK
jgi:hypothetical protein